MESKIASNEAIRAIHEEIASFRRSKSNLPTTAYHATEKLVAKSLSLDEIEHRREAFSTQSSQLKESYMTALEANALCGLGCSGRGRLRSGMKRMTLSAI